MRHRKARELEARLCGTGFGARYWFSMDCCGWVCASLTWFFLIYASYVVYFVILVPWKGDPFSFTSPPNLFGWFHFIGFFGSVFLAMWSHLKTMLTDPGAVPLTAVPLDYYNEPPYSGRYQEHHEICKQCDAFKPKTAHHCSICSRCVVRMDHHCVWSNNCIGQTNHKFFLLFVFYITVACVWSTYLLVARFIICSRGFKYENGQFFQTLAWCEKNPARDSLLVVFLAVEAMFFGLFTTCMLCDQYGVVTAGASHIDQMKARKMKKEIQLKSVSENLAHIFGGDGTFSVSWFLPIDAKWKNPEKEFAFMLPIVKESAESFEDADTAGGVHQTENSESSEQHHGGFKTAAEMV